MGPRGSIGEQDFGLYSPTWSCWWYGVSPGSARHLGPRDFIGEHEFGLYSPTWALGNTNFTRERPPLGPYGFYRGTNLLIYIPPLGGAGGTEFHQGAPATWALGFYMGEQYFGLYSPLGVSPGNTRHLGPRGSIGEQLMPTSTHTHNSLVIEKAKQTVAILAQDHIIRL